MARRGRGEAERRPLIAALRQAPSAEADPFVAQAERIRACRICRDRPRLGAMPLPHEPRPIVQGTSRARLVIASQAPGNRAHVSGIPFQDPSGIRLRAWLGLDERRFYDPDRVAIVPMGACFPGHDRHGGDLPPRLECTPLWREKLLGALPRTELILLIGLHSQRWHLGVDAKAGLTQTVERWREILGAERSPRLLPMPHPSWRNTAWLKRHPWFEAELLPVLRERVAKLAA